MPCCAPTIQSFVNALQTIIPYSLELQALYGSTPNVQAIYINEAGQYQSAGFGVSMTISEGNITVDHGGLSTGLIIIR